jgi:hypothetical protein
VRGQERSRPPRRRAGFALLWALAFSGCASHHKDLISVRESLASGDTEAAVAAFEKREQKKKDLLYLLERGYMMHVAGRWQESNEAFQKAEDRALELFTKSLSRGAASLVSNDLALPYRSVPHELQLVQYYRALNYLELGAPDEALVEARKANAYLARYAEQTEGQELFRQDAFLQYFTGLLYESRGEANDAVVSLRDATSRYREYESAYGQGAPTWLLPDYFAAAEHVGLAPELDSLRALDSSVADRAREGNAHNAVIFFECGWVPYRESVVITLPVFEDKTLSQAEAAARYVDTYQDHLYDYEEDNVELDHVLSFAFPALVEVPPGVATCELVLPSGEVRQAEPALNLGAVAAADFRRRLPGILLKTVARALAKETLRKEAKGEDETLGWIVNAINVATEQADTRGWVLLPGQFYMLKAELPDGPQVLTARFLSAEGVVLEEKQRTVEIRSGETCFAAFRSFR